MNISGIASRRIKELPPYLFAAIEEKIERMRKQGIDIISFGIGDPDLPAPEHVVKACIEAAKKKENYRYPSWSGKKEFKEAAAKWIKEYHNVSVDPEKEVLALIGSKDGIYHVHYAFIDSDDIALCPDPGYPVYRTATKFAGGMPYIMPLREENSFLPDLSAIPKKVAKKAKLMWLNYPNNPTASVATEEFYKEAVDFAKENNIIICSDEAYIYLSYEKKQKSILEIDRHKEVSIVFYSLSKTFNMTGFRIGYAAGNEEIIKALGKIKSNADSGVAQIMQDAGIAALTSQKSKEFIKNNIETYKKRRNLLVEALESAGFKVSKPEATFYVWLKISEKLEKGSSMKFAEKVLKHGIVVTPGIGFGEHGEGYVRFALTQSEERIKEGVERIKKALKSEK